MALRRVRFDIRQASKHILLALAALLLLDVVFFVLMVRPRAQEYRGLLENTKPRFDELEARRAEVEGLETYLSSVRKTEDDLKNLRQDVLSTRPERMVQVQLELADLAAEFSIDLNSVTYENTILENEELDRFAMVVPLAGGYANLRRFLRAAEKSDKFLVVERVGLAQEKQGGVLLQLNITLATYFNAPEDVLEKNRRRETRRERPRA